MRKKLTFGLGWSFLFLIGTLAGQTQMSASLETPMIINEEPRPWQGRHLRYRSIDLSSTVRSRLAQDESSEQAAAAALTEKCEISLSSHAGQALLGKVLLTIDPEYLIHPKDSIRAMLSVKTEHDFQIPDSFLYKSFAPGEPLEFTIPGVYAESVNIVLENVSPEANALLGADLQEIQLNNATTRIMLLGDSITKGTGATDGIGYRKVLYQLLDNYNFDFDFVGDTGTQPYEGHFEGGRKIGDFYPWSLGHGGTGRMDVTLHMNTYRPNMITILLGTNDILSEFPAPAPYGGASGFYDTMSGRMATLVNYLLKWHDGTYGSHLQSIVVGLSVPVEKHEPTTVKFVAEVSKMIRDFSEGSITGTPEPVYECDHFSRFTENKFLWFSDMRGLMDDAYHPSDNGHALIAQNFFKSIKEVLTGLRWFSDISWRSGIAGHDPYLGSQGLSLVDVTSDDLDDIYISRHISNETNQREFFYASQPDHHFIEDAKTRELDDPGVTRGLVFVDIDNDGDYDLFNGGVAGRNRLYRNLGNHTFQDITSSAGLVDLGSITTTSVMAFDAEGDGDMDLYAVNSRYVNELYINNGSGQFQRKNQGANDKIESSVPSLSGTAADFDSDGDVDIYIVKRNASNLLLVNDGNGYFTDRTVQAGVNITQQSNGAVWADLDNDADLDLLVTGTATKEGEHILLTVLRNNGNATFSDISSQVNIPVSGYSVLVGDFDNDGLQDIITTGEDVKGAFFRNNGSWNFSIEQDTGAELFSGDARGAGILDYEADGDLDWVAVRADGYNSFIRNNLDNGYHHLRVESYGPDGNRGGYGTRIWVYREGELGNPSALLGYREVVSASGHQSQSTPVQHFGLKNNSRVDLFARFTDGTFLIERGLAADQTVTIRPELQSAQAGEPARLEVDGGDFQTAVVGEQLKEPLSVRVLDDDDIPVQGAAVEFNVKSGEVAIIDPIANDDNIAVELERGTLTPPLYWAYDSKSSGNGLVFVPGYKSGTGTVSVSATVQTGVAYSVWIRAFHSSSPRSVRVQVGNHAGVDVPVDSYGQYAWYRLKDGDGAAQRYTFNTASQTLELQASPHTYIDKVILAPDEGYLPSGMGASEGSPLLTDAGGITSRMIQLGTIAGPFEVSAQLLRNGQPVSGEDHTFTGQARAGAPVTLNPLNDQQAGEIGVPLSLPFIVEVKDAFGNGVPSISVTFELLSGGGSISPSGVVLTDVDGRALTTLTPGDESSLQQVRATVDGLSASPHVFSAMVGGIAYEMVKVAGDSQSTVVQTTLDDPVRVRVLLENGDPAPSYPVTFRVTEGGGVVQNHVFGKTATYQTDSAVSDSVLTLLTDDQGYAEAYWRLGESSGVQKLAAEAPGLIGSPILFQAIALPDQPFRVFAFDGNQQSASILSQLPEPFTVRVVDTYNNPVPDVSVNFTSLAGGGLFPASGAASLEVATDSSGFAKAVFQLGSVIGENVYHAQASVLYHAMPLEGSPVDFYASGLAGQAARAFKLTTDGQVDTVARVLAEPLKVRVTDQFENPVSAYTVIFSVTGGNGRMNGFQQISRQTNQEGIAQVNFQLGTRAGNLIHRVTAECPGLSPDSLVFRASAVNDVPQELEQISGNDQAAPVFSTLPAPFITRVVDRYENPVADVQVNYQVESATGSFGNSRLAQVYTDDQGLARAFFTLGDEIGDSLYSALASSSYEGIALENSPVRFVASATHSYPVRLIPITDGTMMLGAAYQELTDPLVVKIVDEDNQGLPGVPVEFSIASGGGHFAPSQEAVYQAITDTDGLASARWVLGQAGSEQKVVAEAIFNNEHLQNSPYSFQAIAVATQATRLAIVSGTDQTGCTGSPLPDPLVVKVLDNLSLPVADHPVRFRVEDDGGTFESSGSDQVVIYTGEDGTAQARFMTGGQVGYEAYRIRVSSNDPDGNVLTGSPAEFVVNNLACTPDVDHSEVTATSPVPATGEAQSHIRVRLKDAFGNPISSRQVRLISQPAGLSISPLEGETDAKGRFLAYASSSLAQTFEIRCQDVESGQWLSTVAQAEFIDSDAAEIRLVSGYGQTGYLYSRLAQSLVVRILDDAEQPVDGYPVRFVANGDSATIVGEEIVLSDADGYARAEVRLGSYTGSTSVVAWAPGLLNNPVSFYITINEPGELQLAAVGPQTISGTVAQPEIETIHVRLTDPDGLPVANRGIYFQSQAPSIARPDSVYRRTDVNGETFAHIRFLQTAGRTEILAYDESEQAQTQFVVRTTSGPASNLALFDGNNQKGIVGQALADPLVVRVIDEYGNGVESIPVRFQVKQGGGQLLDPALQQTDSLGYSRMSFQLGSDSGVQQVQAGSDSLPQKLVLFSCYAKSGQAARLNVTVGNQQTGIAGHKLSQPITVLVTDAFDNGVSGTSILFDAEDDYGRTYPGKALISDSLGRVRVHWVLGPAAGRQHLLAVRDGLENSPLRIDALAMANHAPVLQVADSFSVRENELLEFTVGTTDQEQDRVEISTNTLPPGAVFDSLKFSWTPDYQQSGNHFIHFVAADTAGGQGEKLVKIRVDNVNRPPAIVEEETRPAERNLVTVKKWGTVPFFVKATDADGDSLRYIWRVNGQNRGAQPAFTFEGQLYDAGATTVEALVFDPFDTTRATWQFDLITAVELASFEGSFAPFEGVELRWKTRRESQNRGFYVLRSLNDAGPFEHTGGLIPANDKSQYRFVDGDVDVETGQKLYYRLQDMQWDGSMHEHEQICVDLSVPTDFALYQNFPNPFNPSTVLRFAVPKGGRISVEIYNILGERVKTMVNGTVKAGYYEMEWDGRNDAGKAVGSGVYYLIFETADERMSRKMVLVR